VIHQVKTFKQQRQVRVPLDMAFKEVMLGDCIHHPNLARILDIYVGDVPRIVFAWEDGSMLLQMAVDSQGGLLPAFSQQQQANLILHERSIVHSAIRPSAVVLHFGPGRTPKRAQILDLAGAAVRGLVSEAASGPLDYTAPEWLLGCSDLCPLADVWSVGVLAAFVITGRPFFGLACDAEKALTNIIEVMGGVDSADAEALCNLPNWKSAYSQAELGLPWEGPIVKAGGSGAERLVRQMLVFSSARSLFTAGAISTTIRNHHITPPTNTTQQQHSHIHCVCALHHWELIGLAFLFEFLPPLGFTPGTVRLHCGVFGLMSLAGGRQLPTTCWMISLGFPVPLMIVWPLRSSPKTLWLTRLTVRRLRAASRGSVRHGLVHLKQNSIQGI
jgi:serine/threonine protein kinase